MLIDFDLQKRYATTLLELEQLNKDLNKVLHEVQQYCCEVCYSALLPEWSFWQANGGKNKPLTIRLLFPAGPGSGHGSFRPSHWAAPPLWRGGPSDGPTKQFDKGRPAEYDKCQPHAPHLSPDSSASADQGTVCYKATWFPPWFFVHN